MFSMKKALKISLIVAGILGGVSAQAANNTGGPYTVLQLTTDAERYAGCMIKISPGPETVFPNCGTAFVSLGCDGSADPLISKSSAAQLYTTAQIGYVTDKPLYLRINDENVGTTPRGYCYADRVDVR